VKTLVLGGARSGKSRLAERLAVDSGLEVVYVATAGAGDGEMTERIAAHRARRPPSWRLVEEPLRLAAALREQAAPERCLLVDCLTLWLSNLLCADEPRMYAQEREALLEAFGQLPGQVIVVSNEVGLGVVPMGALSRRFVDEAGWLHQALAAVCERVVFTAAGLPLVMKGDPL
jgi:adenosylcobinamide kinase/adenosylcobinamide-phosphate guanylyltransferase